MPYEEADGVSHAEVQGLLHDNASCFEIGLATVDLALLPSNIEQIGEFCCCFTMAGNRMYMCLAFDLTCSCVCKSKKTKQRQF